MHLYIEEIKMEMFGLRKEDFGRIPRQLYSNFERAIENVRVHFFTAVHSQKMEDSGYKLK